MKFKIGDAVMFKGTRADLVAVWLCGAVTSGKITSNMQEWFTVKTDHGEVIVRSDRLFRDPINN